MKVQWKTIASAPANTRLLVCNIDIQDSAIARFSRLSSVEAVWGWIWAIEARATKNHLCLLTWEPTHWAEAPEIPAKPRAVCPKGKCKMTQ